MSSSTEPEADYKILKSIGQGAFGDAYLGIHLKEKKEYVIKQVDIKNKSREEEEHIKHEVRLLQQFHHVNIVQYRDSYRDRKGLLNIVMEYCEGGDMNQIIEKSEGSKIPEEKIVYWLGQMALAIFYMHDKKILHRDLKSPNIFIMEGDVRLGDFGISKVLDHVRDLAQTNIGTPYYMSPEQYNHKPYSYKSDIWAFGCILYEMCNQRRPFQANNIQALGMKVVRGNFPPVSECYSKDLRALIAEMLLKNPSKRPSIIEVINKPFVKKRVVDFMKVTYMKKDSLSKQIISSLAHQAKKLGVELEQKPKAKSSNEKKSAEKKERSTSAKKRESVSSLSGNEYEKVKAEREKKKQLLERQLNKQSEERKEMAMKLKKIEEEKQSLMVKKNNQSNTRSIYEKVKAESLLKGKGESTSEKQCFPMPKVKENNLVGSEVESQNSKKKTSDSSNDVSERQNQQKSRQVEKQLIYVESLESPVQDKKAFQMQEEYEMDFEDCQPQMPDIQENYSDQEFEESQSYKDMVNRVSQTPSFAEGQMFSEELKQPPKSSTKESKKKNSQNPSKPVPEEYQLAEEVKEIQNLVKETNFAVKQATKEFVIESMGSIESSKVIEEKPKQEDLNDKQSHIRHEEKKQTEQLENKRGQQNDEEPKKVEVNLEKAETLKKEIRSKNEQINSLRNELSNIDFELSDTDGEEEVIIDNRSFFKKRQFNQQHVKISDRINTLKVSAQTILGIERYSKFYEYLTTMREKGRIVKRDYLETALGKDKVGVYHLINEILKLSNVLEKVPKYLE